MLLEIAFSKEQSTPFEENFMMTYGKTILSLINESPFDIDSDIQISGRPPTMASSEFLTNKEQGDWTE